MEGPGQPRTDGRLPRGDEWDLIRPVVPSAEQQTRGMAEGRRLRRAIRQGAMWMRVLCWLSGLGAAAIFVLLMAVPSSDERIFEAILLLAICLGVLAFIYHAASAATLNGAAWVPTALGVMYLLGGTQQCISGMAMLSRADELKRMLPPQLHVPWASIYLLFAFTAGLNVFLTVVFLRAAVAVCRFRDLPAWCFRAVLDEEVAGPATRS